MAEPGPDHRARTLSDLRRMFERFENAATRVGAPGSAVRERYAEEAALLKDAIHYVGADDHLAKAKAVKGLADPTANALIEALLPDLLLILLLRLGADVRPVEVSVDEIDARPRGLVMDMQVINRLLGSHFAFHVRRKDA